MKTVENKYETNKDFNVFIEGQIRKHTAARGLPENIAFTSYSILADKAERDFQVELNYLLIDDLMNPDVEAEEKKEIIQLTPYQGQQILTMICEEYTVPFHTMRLFISVYDLNAPMIVSVDYMVKKRKR